ncbi:MAG: FtsX-like permease family protein [Polyangiaceae bacterium]|nr:FtsX-like permease family protein [Polyangiaceae bacterium]
MPGPALRSKLLRDLVRLRGQALTIALVVACGVSSFVALRSAYASLVASAATYYERQRFADVFARLERAPAAVAERLARVPGVAQVEVRVVEAITVPLAGLAQPAVGTLVSLPDTGTAALNVVHVARGRAPDPERPEEILVLDAFAEAHGLSPGDSLPIVIDGRRRELVIAGTALSPEHVFTVPPGAMSHDPKQIVVAWAPRRAVAAAVRMEGAFNDAAFRLQPGASEPAALTEIDRVLAPYGTMGAVPRARQSSHAVVAGELEQLRSMATFVPFLFAFVAAFLLHVVLSRLVLLQRGQIATLKAVGYEDRAIGWHYAQLVGAIVAVGIALGLGAGAWLGEAMVEMYTGRYFRFPSPSYRLDLGTLGIGVGISLAAAALGAGGAVRQVVRLPPAEAMQPPAPARPRRSVLERLGFGRALGAGALRIAREIERRPVRTLLSTIGISFCVAIAVVAGFWSDATDFMLDVQFHGAMREDVTVTFTRPLPRGVLGELRGLPGVRRAEGLAQAPVRFRVAHRHRDGLLAAHEPSSELRRWLDARGAPLSLPPTGVVLGAKLAEVLGVRVGDVVTIEAKAGERRTAALTVSGLADEAFGLQGHVHPATLTGLIGGEGAVEAALLRVDSAALGEVLARLRAAPWTAAVARPGTVRQQFEEQSGGILRVYTLLLVGFAAVIAVGVVYNDARIALSQRSRDFASLRVLGFTRGEVARMLAAELTVQVVLALPLGLVLGSGLVDALISTVDAETYRLPALISVRTYAFAASITLVAAVASFLLVRRRLDALDLIGVLKTRE